MFAEGEWVMTTNVYTLATWLYCGSIKKDKPEIKELPISAYCDEGALSQASREVSSLGNVVGALKSPDDRTIVRRYVIIRKIDCGNGDIRENGSWNFFAVDDEAAKNVLENKEIDWMNILYGPEGIVSLTSA